MSMSLRSLLIMAGLTLLVGVTWLFWPNAKPTAQPAALIMPELSAASVPITTIVERGAGHAVLATLTLQAGQWRVQERDGWPANAAVVATVLDALKSARAAQAKTRLPERHARLGVEAMDQPDAKGVELCLQPAPKPLCLVLGDTNPVSGYRYVRRSEQAQAWLLDRALEVPRSAAQWLDRSLVDRPMARIERVQLAPATGTSFQLTRVHDRFSLDAMPAAAMADPDRGSGTASLLDALVVEDVALDAEQAAQQTVTFVGVDGLDVVIEAWTAPQGVWLRCRPHLDQARATAWNSARLADLRAEYSRIEQRCSGHVFRLPAIKAENLMRSREQYLAG